MEISKPLEKFSFNETCSICGSAYKLQYVSGKWICESCLGSKE
jgi:hypothetical protein